MTRYSYVTFDNSNNSCILTCIRTSYTWAQQSLVCVSSVTMTSLQYYLTVCNCLPLSVLSAYFCFTLATTVWWNKVDILRVRISYVMHFIISIINHTSDVLRSLLPGFCWLYDDIRRGLDRQKLCQTIKSVEWRKRFYHYSDFKLLHVIISSSNIQNKLCST